MVEYKKAETDFKAWLRQADLDNSKVKIHAFSKMEYLKQIATRGKLDEIKNFVRDQFGLTMVKYRWMVIQTMLLKST